MEEFTSASGSDGRRGETIGSQSRKLRDPILKANTERRKLGVRPGYKLSKPVIDVLQQGLTA